MKKISLLAALIILSGITGCHKEEVPKFDLSTFSIFWQESSSWADFYYKAAINQDGDLDVQEKYGLSNKYRESEYKIPDEDVLLIIEKLNDLVSIDISDAYGFNNDNAATDLPATKMKYFTTNKSDSAYISASEENELPKELETFLQVVHQIILENDTLK